MSTTLEACDRIEKKRLTTLRAIAEDMKANVDALAEKCPIEGKTHIDISYEIAVSHFYDWSKEELASLVVLQLMNDFAKRQTEV